MQRWSCHFLSQSLSCEAELNIPKELITSLFGNNLALTTCAVCYERQLSDILAHESRRSIGKHEIGTSGMPTSPTHKAVVLTVVTRSICAREWNLRIDWLECASHDLSCPFESSHPPPET